MAIDTPPGRRAGIGVHPARAMKPAAQSKGPSLVGIAITLHHSIVCHDDMGVAWIDKRFRVGAGVRLDRTDRTASDPRRANSGSCEETMQVEPASEIVVCRGRR